MTINLMTKTGYRFDIDEFSTLFFPNCEKSKLLASLTGKKTLDENDIDIIKSLGYEVFIDSNTML